MSDMKVDSILQQIRALREQSPLPSTALESTPRVDFSQLLQQSLDGVNASQKNASELTTAFERGDPNVSITEVMVNMQKAQVSFKAAVEVRNKLVDAYQEVMRMSM
ncbi:flagellar hook-basal body complex protein FliE [Spongiibacter tropicus]|uniref:flagellar hook-basal body complex protein FliE n=1 Tax=Spongiibacter tropicus TaxID=454602 RepID=UPI003A9924D1